MKIFLSLSLVLTLTNTAAFAQTKPAVKGAVMPETRLGHHEYKGRVKTKTTTYTTTAYLFNNGRYASEIPYNLNKRTITPADTLAKPNWRQDENMPIVAFQANLKEIVTYDLGGFEVRHQIFLDGKSVSDLQTVRDARHRPLEKTDKVNLFDQPFHVSYQYSNAQENITMQRMVHDANAKSWTTVTTSEQVMLNAAGLETMHVTGQDTTWTEYDALNRMVARTSSDGGRNTKSIMAYGKSSTSYKMGNDYHFYTIVDTVTGLTIASISSFGNGYSFHRHDSHGNFLSTEFNEEGKPSVVKERSAWTYDAKGNWTKRVVSTPGKPDEVYSHAFTYYD